MKLTANQIAVLKTFVLNYDTAEDNKADNACYTDVADAAMETGKTVKSVRGIMGSLAKKGLITHEEGGETGEDDIQCLTDAGIDVVFQIMEEEKNVDAATLDKKEVQVDINDTTDGTPTPPPAKVRPSVEELIEWSFNTMGNKDQFVTAKDMHEHIQSRDDAICSENSVKVVLRLYAKEGRYETQKDGRKLSYRRAQ